MNWQFAKRFDVPCLPTLSYLMIDDAVDGAENVQVDFLFPLLMAELKYG